MGAMYSCVKIPLATQWIIFGLITSTEKRKSSNWSSLENPRGEAEVRNPDALKTQFQRLSLTIRRHEAEENELVMEAYWDTLGGVD